MQKKLIALAIAAAASTGVLAQSNVTIYGIADYGVTARFGKLDGNDGKDSSRFVLDGGQSAGNRLGFKGVEDLGNGLKAVFVLERGFNLDTGADRNTDATTGVIGGGNKVAVSGFNRQAYVALAGGFGTVAGGRLYTPHYTFVSGLDPFGDGTVGAYSNTYGGNELDGALNPKRVDNTVAYISPSFSGFVVTGAYSNNAFGDDNHNGAKDQNNRVFALLGKYDSGPLSVGLSFHHIAAKNYDVLGLIPAKNVNNWVLGGSYDLTSVKIAAFVGQNKVKFDVDGIENLKATNFMVGVTAPFGPNALKASFNYSKIKQAQLLADNNKAYQFAVGYDYSLSKRTTFYSALSYIKNGDNRFATVGDASNSGGIYKTGLQAGIRHAF